MLDYGYLSNVFQPSSQTDEDQEHWRRLEERLRTPGYAHRHSNHNHSNRVEIGHARGKHYENVHVCLTVAQDFEGVYVETTTCKNLQKRNRNKASLTEH